MMRFPVTGVLLAGGQSRRMGFPKGQIKFKGQTLAEKAFNLLAATCDEILLSASHSLYNFLKASTITDEIQNAGPVGGIYSAMKAAAFTQILVLPVDLPFIEEVHLRHILEMAKNEEIPVIPRHPDGKTEPLCGVYPTAMAEQTKQLLLNGQFKVTGLLEIAGFKPLPVNQFPEFHNNLFFNINSPEDLEKLHRL